MSGTDTRGHKCNTKGLHIICFHSEIVFSFYTEFHLDYVPILPWFYTDFIRILITFMTRFIIIIFLPFFKLIFTRFFLQFHSITFVTMIIFGLFSLFHYIFIVIFYLFIYFHQSFEFGILPWFYWCIYSFIFVILAFVLNLSWCRHMVFFLPSPSFYCGIFCNCCWISKYFFLFTCPAFISCFHGRF